MRTDDFRPSDNVEDNRQTRGGIPGGAGGLGIGTIVIVGLISWYFGIDPSVLLNGAQILTGDSSSQQTAPPASTGTPNDATGKFVALVLGDTEDTWKEIFAAGGRTYHAPKLRLFSGAEQGGCGLARSAAATTAMPASSRRPM
jgi:predicted metalloprotease